MSSTAALNAVSQIQALADGPQTAEMLSCLSQVATSLQYFLDHPDNYVRLCASRALLKLSRSYREELMKLDLSKARALHSRLVAENADADDLAPDTKELQEKLGEVLVRLDPDFSGCAGNGQEPPNSAGTDDTVARRNNGAAVPRGEVVLKAAEAIDAKASILPQVVKVAGVVSVTFESEYIIVNTRNAAIAKDAGFLADLLVAVKEHGLQGVSLVSTAPVNNAEEAGLSSTTRSAEAPGAGHDAAAQAGKRIATEPAAPLAPAPHEDADLREEDEEEDMDEDDGAFGYLDEETPEQAEAKPAAGADGQNPNGLGGESAQYSFFATTSFMQTRKMQQFEDDPSMVARLARAKKKEQERKEAEKGTFGRLRSWLGQRG